MGNLQKLNKMPVTITKKSPHVIKVERAYMVQKLIGLFIMTVSTLTFVLFMLLQPERMGKSQMLKAFSVIVVFFLIFFLVREFYFLYIDKSNCILKIEDRFKINNSDFLLKDIDSLLIIEYNGIGIMSNGYNVFIKLKSRKKVPISIRVSKIDMENIKDALGQFLDIKKIEKKKWWIG